MGVFFFLQKKLLLDSGLKVLRKEDEEKNVYPVALRLGFNGKPLVHCE